MDKLKRANKRVGNDKWQVKLWTMWYEKGQNWKSYKETMVN